MNADDLKPRITSRRSARSRLLACVHGRLAEERGQALVELAFVIPVLLLVLFAIAQFGLALNTANDQTHLANEVARYAVVNENPGAAKAKSLQLWAKEQADEKPAREKGSICITFPNGTSNVGDPVKVEFKSTIKWFPILKLRGLTTTTVAGTATMRLEGSPTAYSAGCA